MKLFSRLLVALMLTVYSAVSFAAVTVSVNGTNHTIPQTNEKGWGANVTAWIQAISANTLQPSGGTFTLTADTNFGANYGLLSNYYKSRSSNISSAGVLRLSNTDQIGFRNAANSGNLLLGVDASDRLTFNGSAFLPTAALTASRLLVSDASGVVSVSSVTSTEAGYLSGVGTDLCGIDDTCTLTNKTLTSPAITTPTGIVKGDVGLGNVDNTSDATKNAAAVTLTNKTLTSPIISTISNTGTLTLPTSTDTLVGRDTTDTLTNKTLTSAVLNTGVSGTAIVDEDDMISDSATKVPTQQSVKAYVDAEVAGAASAAVVNSYTTTQTLTSANQVVLLSSAGGAYTVTLFTAVGNEGHKLTLKKTTSDVTAITIDGDGTETIDGVTTTTLNTIGETLNIISDGANWQILDRKIPSIPVAYTPTFTGFGTAASVSFTSWREGAFLVVQGKFTSGTSTATEGRVTLGFNGTNANVTSASTIPTLQIAGSVVINVAGTYSSYALIEPSVGYLTFAIQSAGRSSLAKINGDTWLGTGTIASFQAKVPIDGWKN